MPFSRDQFDENSVYRIVNQGYTTSNGVKTSIQRQIDTLTSASNNYLPITTPAALFATYFATGSGTVTVNVPAGRYIVDAGHSNTQVSAGGASITGSGLLTVPSNATSVAVQRPEIPGFGIEPVTWTTVGNAGSSNSADWRGFEFGNGIYVGLGSNATEYRTSTDLITWTVRNLTWSGIPGPNCIAFGAGVFVIGGQSHNIYTSTNGISWTQRTSYSTALSNGRAAIFARGQFLVGGEGGFLGTSIDGITWVTRTSGTATTIQDFAEGAGRYVAVLNGSPYVITSTDAITWTTGSWSGTTSAIDVAYGSTGGFVAPLSTSGQIASSTDGITWTTRSVGINNNSNSSISFGGGVYCLGQSISGVITSTNGVTWTARSTGLSVGKGVSTVGGVHIAGNALSSSPSISYAQAQQNPATPQPTYARVQRLTDS